MLKKILTLISLFIYVLLFQNCDHLESSTLFIAEESPRIEITTDPVVVIEHPKQALSYSERLTLLNKKRIKDWKSTHPYWEVVYDGVDTPADNVTGPFMWDNPIDDDWFDPHRLGPESYMDQFRLNTYYKTPSVGYLTVDRTYDANFKTGSIYRRDEWLDSNYTRALFGFTMEVRVKILPTSELDAFFINYIANDCTISVALSAGGVSPTGSISSGSVYGKNTNHRAVDTTTNFNTYRIVRGPLSPTFKVYIVNYADEDLAQPISFSKIHEGVCDPSLKVGQLVNIKFPYIQVGDNSNDVGKNAAFILDFIRYRRDAIEPSSPLQSLQPRAPMPLPTALQGGDAHLYNPNYLGIASGGFFGDLVITSPEAKILMGEDVRVPGRSWLFKTGDLVGTTKLKTGVNGFTNAEIIHPRGLSDGGAFTLEARLKFSPEAGDRGFRILHLDIMGAVAIHFSKDKVETGMGAKPVGFIEYKMDTTDRFHTYKLVRKAGEIYAHLYVDDDPIPVIVDQHLSAEVESRGFEANPILSFGGYQIYPEPFLLPVKTTSTDVEIDYIRWHGYESAPVL